MAADEALGSEIGVRLSVLEDAEAAIIGAVLLLVSGAYVVY